MRMGTLVVGAVVLAVIGAAVRKLYRDKKGGKTCNCGCGNCGGCPGGRESGNC